MKQALYSRAVVANMVVANMIGTGIFTSIGYQVMPGAIPDPFAIMMIWLIGGVFSLCGALAYAEVATTLCESGGEYTFLSKIYHPILGLSSGIVSLIVGFSAAVASLALAAGKYLGPATDSLFNGQTPGYIPKLVGVSIILLVAFIQLRGVRVGGIFQNIMTNMKLLLIAVLILGPLMLLSNNDTSGISFLPSAKSYDTVFSVSFAGSLVWVLFAYSGWNASAYVAENMRDPKKNLPYSLLVGTGIVTVVYLALTAVFMYTCSFDEMAGVMDVGNVVVKKVFHPQSSVFFGCCFAVALIAGINAMFIAGPRVTQKMGNDHASLSVLGRESESGAPTTAIALQTVIAISMVVFSDFKSIIEYVGLTLTIFSTMTVLGVFVLRYRKMEHDGTVRMFGYPFTPLLFLAVSVWMIIYFVMEDPMKLFWSVLTILPAIPLHYMNKPKRVSSDRSGSEVT